VSPTGASSESDQVSQGLIWIFDVASQPPVRIYEQKVTALPGWLREELDSRPDLSSALHVYQQVGIDWLSAGECPMVTESRGDKWIGPVIAALDLALDASSPAMDAGQQAGVLTSLEVLSRARKAASSSADAHTISCDLVQQKLDVSCN
jgi:hypothetical protein